MLTYPSLRVGQGVQLIDGVRAEVKAHSLVWEVGYGGGGGAEVIGLEVRQESTDGLGESGKMRRFTHGSLWQRGWRFERDKDRS